MTLGEAERYARNLFAKAGVDSPGLCARLLAGHVLGLDKLACATRPETIMDAVAEARFRGLARRRAMGEPLAYILGKKEFYEHDFLVTPATLVPRPETEMLVDLALERMPGQCGDFVDLGCGCGCIGLSIADLRPFWRAWLLDKSLAALDAACINRQNIASNARLLAGDLFCPPFQAASMDIVVSNPPYIAPEEKNQVMACVLAYEPAMALFSPDSGMAHIEAVIRGACFMLRPGGWVILEHGQNQAKNVCWLLQLHGFAHIENYDDLAGLPRCSVGQKLR